MSKNNKTDASLGLASLCISLLIFAICTLTFLSLSVSDTAPTAKEKADAIKIMTAPLLVGLYFFILPIVSFLKTKKGSDNVDKKNKHE
jgi:CBS domain containing-hemolysin-like protein